jgi:hypothetical protein
MRVTRKPARPWVSNVRRQKRNSSSDSWYQRQASSRVISPLRTAATTAALRRTTHLLVVGGGRPSVGEVRIVDRPGSVSTARYGASEGSTSHERGPSLADPPRTVAPYPLLSSRSTFQSPRASLFPLISRSFDAFERVCHQFFEKKPQSPLRNESSPSPAIRRPKSAVDTAGSPPRSAIW